MTMINDRMDFAELNEEVDKLEALAFAMSREARSKAIKDVTDRYIRGCGNVPQGILTRLTNVFLHEELTDKHPDKMSRRITADMTEDEVRRHTYPIMSDSQYERRTTGRQRNQRKDGMTIREVPLDKAINHAMDGRDYNLPIRKIRQ